MSKKKKKKAAKVTKAKKKSKKPGKKPGKRTVTSKRTAAATIFVYKVDGQSRVRTSPQRLGAGPGFIEWTVVNLTSLGPTEVVIGWPGESPWGGKTPILIRDGNVRVSLEGAKDGLYKYNVTANGYTEDPEIEIPEM